MKTLFRRLLCFFGWHEWSWLHTGGVIRMNDDPPPGARCKHCNTRYDDSDFGGYPE